MKRWQSAMRDERSKSPRVGEEKVNLCNATPTNTIPIVTPLILPPAIPRFEDTCTDKIEEQDEEEDQNSVEGTKDLALTKAESRLVLSDRRWMQSPTSVDSKTVQGECFETVFKLFTGQNCKNQQVKITDICMLLGRIGTCSAKTTKHEYAKFSKEHELPSYALHRYEDAPQSERRREAWLETWAALCYMRSVARYESARTFVQKVDSEILNRARSEVVAANERLSWAKQDATRFATLTMEEDLRVAKEEAAKIRKETATEIEDVRREAQQSIQEAKHKADTEVRRSKRKFDAFVEAMTCKTDVHGDRNSNRAVPIKSDSGVYVLELNTFGRYYVGQSSNIPRRLAQHKSGERSAAYVMANGGYARALEPMTPRIEDLYLWEQNETICRMMEHGITNVRGFEFTSVGHLPQDKLMTIKTLFFGLGDFCRRCGRKGHFIKECTEKTKVDWLIEIEALISTQMSRTYSRWPPPANPVSHGAQT